MITVGQNLGVKIVTRQRRLGGVCNDEGNGDGCVYIVEVNGAVEPLASMELGGRV